MSWARSGATCAWTVATLASSLSALPSNSAYASEPRPVDTRPGPAPRIAQILPPRRSLDLSRILQRGDHFVAPLASGREERLTLDPFLQQAAMKILASASAVHGGMVVIDARTGNVLAWAESGRDGRHHHVLDTASVPAASVFKLVTTAALFETTTLSPRDEICISGGTHGIERRHLDAPQGGELSECSPFAYAIGYSKNAVFAQLATHRLLRRSLIDTAQALGFNGQVPFDLEVAVGTLQVPYGDLDFARAAAGFQGSTLSPLGAAHIANVIAHGGESTRIRVIARDPEDADEPAEVLARVLTARTAERMRRMMEVTVRSGTCRHAFSDERARPYLGAIRVSGKTGTLRAETNEGMTSWFMGFAPSQKPEIIVSVLLENGAVWRRKANELARDLMRAYFHGHGKPWISDPLAPAGDRLAASDGQR